METIRHLVGIVSTIPDLWPYALVAIAMTVAYWYLSSPAGIPPGTAGLPIVGYLPFMDRRSYLTFNKMSKKFGNIFHVYLGSRLVIVLNDYEAVKEAFNKQADIFSGRPEDMNFIIDKNDNFSITTTDGEFWQEHRRFLLKTLRDYGMGKLSLEPRILDEIQHFLRELESYKGKPTTNLKNLFSDTFANNIVLLLSGRRVEYNDALLKDLVSSADTIISPNASSVAFHIFFPWLNKIPVIDIFTPRGVIMKSVKIITAAMLRVIDEAKKSYIAGEKGNYIHAFLTEQNARQTLAEKELFLDKSLLHNVRDLLAAGSQTSAITLMWAIVHMAREPEIQKRIQKEIDDVIGKERQPSWNDRTLTPYTEATLLEIQRMGSIIPLNLTHTNLQDTTLLGHRIPKGSYIISNLWNVHHDPKYWKNPHVFNPDRFLGPDGSVCKPEYLIPFSTGKRACVGESLAKMVLYLYFTSILQQFTILPADSEKPSADGIVGFALIPKTTVFRAVAR